MDPGNEIVTIVDEHNVVIGEVSRKVMRAGRLIHRATYILVFNNRGDLFVHKRTATKDIYPSHYDIAAGGVVLAGESYEESAARELAEELGIREAALTGLFDFFYEDAGNRVWGRAFSCTHDGPVTLQEAEVESGSYLPLPEVLRLAAQEPFTPDGLELLSRYVMNLDSGSKHYRNDG